MLMSKPNSVMDKMTEISDVLAIAVVTGEAIAELKAAEPHIAKAVKLLRRCTWRLYGNSNGSSIAKRRAADVLANAESAYMHVTDYYGT
jgi:hypothetical protein